MAGGPDVAEGFEFWVAQPSVFEGWATRPRHRYF
jgi:hypothetical protein